MSWWELQLVYLIFGNVADYLSRGHLRIHCTKPAANIHYTITTTTSTTATTTATTATTATTTTATTATI